MTRRAFTIVELVIAISIFSLIVVYMYKATATTKKANDIYEQNYHTVSQANELKKVLYNDIFNQLSPYIDNEFKNDVFYLHSKNSLHNLANPYIAYFIKNNSIVRVESLKKITFPLKNEENIFYETDIFLSNVDSLNVFIYQNAYIIEWIQKKKKTLFEIRLPYSRKVIVVQSKDANSSK